jgi:hypothetical protein
MDGDPEMNQLHACRLHYDPARFIDMLTLRSGAKNDVELAGCLGVHHNIIRSIRERRLYISPSMLLWISDVTGLSVHELRTLLGDRRARLRPACNLLIP